MKILNWVHRMFNNKDGLAQNARKSGTVTAGKSSDGIDDQFMLDSINASSGVLFDGWKGGILAIGTFGYDPLIKYENYENDEFLYKEEPEKERLSVLENESDHEITDSEEDEEEEEEEEENPLVFAAYVHDYEGLLEMKTEENRVSLKGEFEFDAMMKNAKKVRTTLAELFSADSKEMQKKQNNINKGEIIKEKSNDKHRLSFAKKLLNGNDARPIHKLHRLMRRMLKRKIHPDAGLNSEFAIQKCETSESASLLPTQDAII